MKRSIMLCCVFSCPSEVKIILQFNTILLVSLQEKITNWSDRQTLAQSFEQMTHLLKVYQNYVNRYDECLKAIVKCKKNADFSGFLEDLHSATDAHRTPR